jgi:maltose alpha-D-glucosyltransferase/alpha-amylase
MTDLWYKNAIFYGVDIKSFCDSNGDGFGDLAGLTGKLDYFSDLGVDCLWLLPFYGSPLADNGYDISDPCAINPRFGTFADFDRLIEEASRRGIQVLIDLVTNHTSDQHPWFQQARRDPTSRYRNYYVWSDEPVALPNTKPIFPGAEESIWEYDELAGQYYLHRFYCFEPDLDTFNPDVCAEILQIMDAWLRRGVDGFRIDAAPYLIRPKGTRPATASSSSTTCATCLRVTGRTASCSARRMSISRRSTRCSARMATG